jgi:hypothetical protein
MRGPVLGQPGRLWGEEREQQLVGFGEIEGALQGGPDGGRIVEYIPGDRSQQEGRRHPDAVDPWDGAVEHGRECGRRSLQLVRGRL